MLQQPKVGDIILLKAIVRGIDPTHLGMTIDFIDCATPCRFAHKVSTRRVFEVIERSLEVGDMVVRTGVVDLPVYGQKGRKLLYIHGDAEGAGTRKWGVVAFMGDIPQSFPLSELQRHS